MRATLAHFRSIGLCLHSRGFQQTYCLLRSLRRAAIVECPDRTLGWLIRDMCVRARVCSLPAVPFSPSLPLPIRTASRTAARLELELERPLCPARSSNRITHSPSNSAPSSSVHIRPPSSPPARSCLPTHRPTQRRFLCSPPRLPITLPRLLASFFAFAFIFTPLSLTVSSLFAHGSSRLPSPHLAHLRLLRLCTSHASAAH
jgi:hypothetical protein